MHASIDFETKNAQHDIRKVGHHRYTDTAEILCMSYSVNNGPVRTWLPGQEPPTDLLDAIAQGCTVHAHNAAFERCIWNKICVPLYGWPQVQRWSCTMARALYAGLPASLDNVGKAIGVDTKKDLSGKKVMLKMTKPRKPRKGEPDYLVYWHDSDKDYAKLISYCETDVASEIEVAAIVPELTGREQSVYSFDTTVNDRGVRVDTELVRACIKLWSLYTKPLNRELAKLTFGAVTAATQNKLITEVLNQIGVAIPNTKKDTVEDWLALPDLSDMARRILEIRYETAKSSVSKYKKMLEALQPDGRIRGCFQYYGASRTGRFAGRLIQLQNLPRGVIKEKDFEAVIAAILSLDLELVAAYGPVGDILSSMIRAALIPADGKRFFVCDFSSIEARVLAWIAGERWLLDAFVNKEDPYVHMASDIYKMSYADVLADAKAGGNKRWWGKTLILGAGYGLGAGGLARQLTKARVKFDGTEYCQELINTYRAKNSNIKKFWYRMKEAAVNCVRSGQPQRCGKIIFHRKDRWLCMRLPSGRDLHYPDPKLVPGKFGKEQVEFTGTKEGKVVRETTYGGKCVENCLAEGSLVLTNSGWKKIELVTTSDLVHDGVEFVSHDGLIGKGVQKCLAVDGVYMTPEHRVLCGDKWEVAVFVNSQLLHRPKHNESDRLVWIKDRRRYHKVYDIVNCGPRHRFVVLGTGGPFIVHNCVQAISRDLLVEAMARLEKAKFNVVMHIHDEIVCENGPEKTFDEMKSIMVQLPKWAEDLPIDAAGFECSRYQK